jgi:hypothetical protein
MEPAFIAPSIGLTELITRRTSLPGDVPILVYSLATALSLIARLLITPDTIIEAALVNSFVTTFIRRLTSPHFTPLIRRIL